MDEEYNDILLEFRLTLMVLFVTLAVGVWTQLYLIYSVT